MEVRPRFVAVGDQLAATLVVTGYPAEVSPGWLEPLLSYPGRVDVALHIDPVPVPVAVQRLRRQRARLESTRRVEYGRGKLDDPETEAAAADAADLAYRVARGEGKLFSVGLYITVHTDDEHTLAEELASVRAVAESILLRVAPATFRALRGWLTTLPFGLDLLGVRRTFDTQALAACFPFASPDLPPADPVAGGVTESAVLYGANTASTSLVLWDRFAADNHNSVTLARSGAGKSYLTKLDLLRSLYQGVDALVVDPEGEYTRLADAVGGTVVRVGAPGVRLNPFDLPDAATAGADALTRRALFAHTLLSVLLGGDVTAVERAVLDTAILAAYRASGITADPRTWSRPAPLLGDLQAALDEYGTDLAYDLAARLAPFTTGSWAGLFDGPTTARPQGHLVVFDLRDLADELKTAGMLLTLDAIWGQVDNPRDRKRRLVVVDEAWRLMRDGEGAKFLFRMSKAARKRQAGLAVVTQDAADVLGTELGQAVVANAATQILMRQAPQAIGAVADAFGLSAGEAEFLLAAPRGEGLLLAGSHRVSFAALASDAEDALCQGLETAASEPGADLAAGDQDDDPSVPIPL
ncbi:VirB4 family type IV secretion system protein [Yinghuangia seranimata]|uniref:VirB4 family type IV secretion system protein n=1 Tax=Yinghuangia seranimata TaxID=408067 RepID=UPI00248C1AA0|nr:DUF87 domain-containing protein [Yinghuangia seranimata]MDI2130575.1 DUF87 domain-containing protein [Yinghuangia seranimata]